MAEIKITAKALGGTHEITITGESEKEAIKQIALFSSLPPVCPECGTGLYFTYRKVAAKEGKKGGTFYGLRCMGDPAHEKYFHVHDNEAQTLYWVDKEKFKIEFAARQAADSSYSGREQWGDGEGEIAMQPAQAVPAQQIEPITIEQKAVINDWIGRNGVSVDWAQAQSKKLFGGRKLGELTKPQGEQVIPALTRALEVEPSAF